jgi:translation initiation factor 2 beta subunit (eIF-2beta)/eIF-5
MNILEEKTNIFNNFDLMFTEGISSEKIEHFLIKRGYEELNKQNNKKKAYKFVLEPLDIDISTNTTWKNAYKIFKIMKRPPKHIIDFLKMELVTDINWLDSHNKDNGLILLKKISKNKLETVINKYCIKYIVCGGYSDSLSGCGSCNTRFKTDKKNKLYNFKCKDCNTIYSCSFIV